MRNNLYRQLKLLAHLANNHQLLIIFFAKNSDPRLYTREQFEHHRAHPFEKIWAKSPFKSIASPFVWLHSEIVGYRIHLAIRGCKKHIHIARILEFFYVLSQRPWVLVKILVRTKL